MRGERPSLVARARGRSGLAVVLAVMLGVLEIWRNTGDGYTAGWGDHFVLAPEGLSWAYPGAFANDWFMEAAPQPHWFFDALTFIGASTGLLSTAYAAFWALGLVAFGAATALLAFRFVPSNAWLVGISVVAIASVTPWMVGGTGSPIIAQALPAVTSASLVYLTIAALVTEVRWVAIAAAPLVALVHVQQGSIVAIILLVALVADSVQHRRVDWRLGVSFGATTALVAFGLILRPVASNLRDFVDICNTVIPYHCAAHSWGWPDLLSTAGIILLAASTVFLVPRHSRVLWWSTVGLVCVGYAAGFLADAFEIPLLGTLAQGTNIYRLGAVAFPFAVWGMLLPVLRPELNRTAALRFAVWAVGIWGFLQSPNGWPPGVNEWLFLVAILAATAYVVVSARRHRRPLPFLIGTGAMLIAAAFVFAAAVGGAITPRTPDFHFVKDRQLVEWGEQVREVVPEGAIVVASPRSEWFKLVSRRAVIADCKNIPYGGEPWREWNRRIDDLGGFNQCVAPGPLLYNELSARQLQSVADRYGSDFIAVDPALSETVAGLERSGWERVIDPVGPSGVSVFARPERA